MMTLHIRQANAHYAINGLKFADEAGWMVYLRARGVTPGHITEALEGLHRDGAYTIAQE